MIRPFTCLCLAAAAGSGLYLYTAKHDAQMLERDIGRITHQAQENRARAAMLRAEYDRLGDPDRLRELAGQVLTLQPTDPRQFSSMVELEQRLPAVGRREDANLPTPSPIAAPAPVSAPVPAVGPTPVPASRPAPPAPRPLTPIVTAALAPAAQVATPSPSIPVPAPARVTPALPRPAPTPSLAAPPAAVAPPMPAPPLLASIRRPPPAEPAPSSLSTDIASRVARAALPQPQGSAPRPAMAPSLATPLLSSPVLSSPVLASPMVASALGMARSAIVVANPISQGNAASFAQSAPPAGVPRR